MINLTDINIRDRPFFVSFRIFFSDNTRVRIYFFCRVKREFFFQNLTLGYMTKTLNQIIFFPPPKSEYFLQQHWESEYFFRLLNLGTPIHQNKTISSVWHILMTQRHARKQTTSVILLESYLTNNVILLALPNALRNLFPNY